MVRSHLVPWKGIDLEVEINQPDKATGMVGYFCKLKNLIPLKSISSLMDYFDSNI